MTRHVGEDSPAANSGGPNDGLLLTLKMDWTIGGTGCGGISDLTSTGASDYATNPADYTFGNVYEIGLQNFPVPPIYGDVRKFDVIAWPNNDRYFSNNEDQYEGIRVLNPQDKPFIVTGNSDGSYKLEMFYRSYKMNGKPYPIYVLYNSLIDDPLTAQPRLLTPIASLVMDGGNFLLKFGDAFDLVSTWRLPGAMNIDGSRHVPNRLFRYTTNGTDPTVNSPAYNPLSPIVLAESQNFNIRVRSFCAGWLSSEIVDLQIDLSAIDLNVYDPPTVLVQPEDAFNYDYVIAVNFDTPSSALSEIIIELEPASSAGFIDPVSYYSLDGGVSWSEYTGPIEFPSGWLNPPNSIGHPCILAYTKEQSGPKRSYIENIPFRIYHPNNQIVLAPDYPETMSVNGRSFTILDTRNFQTATLALENVSHNNTTVDDHRYFEMTPVNLVDPDNQLVFVVNNVRLSQDGTVEHLLTSNQEFTQTTLSTLTWGESSVVGVMLNYRDSAVYFRVDDGPLEGPFYWDLGTNIWMQYVAGSQDMNGTQVTFAFKEVDFAYPIPYRCIPLDSTGMTENNIIPDTPTNLQVVDNGATLDFTWDPVPSATGFVLYMSTDSQDNSSNVYRYNVSGTSLSLPKPATQDINDTYRYFRIAGVNGNNLGDTSNAVQGALIFDGVTLLHFWRLNETSGVRVDSIGGGDMFPAGSGTAVGSDTGLVQATAAEFTHNGQFLMALPGTVSVAGRSFSIVGWTYRVAMANAEYAWDIIGDGNREEDNGYEARVRLWSQGYNNPTENLRAGRLIVQDKNYNATYSAALPDLGWNMVSSSLNRDTGVLYVKQNDSAYMNFGGFTSPSSGEEGPYSLGGRIYAGVAQAETGTRLENFMIFNGVVGEADRQWLYNNGAGRSFSAIVDRFGSLPTPDAPDPLYLEDIEANNYVTVSWDPVPDVDGYRLFRKDRDAPSEAAILVGTQSTSTSRQVVRSTLQSNKVYDFYVCSVKAGRLSRPSPKARLYTGGVVSILRFINGSVGSQVFTDEKGLNWIPNGSVVLSDDVAPLYSGGKVLKSTNGGFIQATSALWQLPAGSRWTMEMYVSITGGISPGYSRTFGQHGTAQESMDGVGFEAYNNYTTINPWIRNSYSGITSAPPYSAIPSPMQHMAASCDGEYINFYFEGVYCGRLQTTGELVSQIVKLGAANGNWVNNASALYIGAFRFTRGLDLYRENFTPGLF